MHILHAEASPHWGGQEMRTLMDAVRCFRLGHRVTILARPEGALSQRARAAGLAVAPLRLGSPWDPRGIAAIARLIRSVGTEVVHTHSSADAWAAGLAARLSGVGLVRTRHISAPMGRRLLGRPLASPVYRLPEAIIATSAAIRDSLLELGVPPERLWVLPSGVDLEQFRPRPEGRSLRAGLGLEGEPVITMVAMLRPEKRADVFLAAASHLRPEFPQALFVLAGGGAEGDLATLRRLAERLGVSAAVRFLGHREDVPEILAASDVCVLPSAGNDGIPQAVVQYLAMARPVVATPVGGIPEVIEEGRTGLLVRPNDPQGLAGSIAWLLRHPEQAKLMGQAGRRLVEERFDADRVARQTLEIYERVLRGKRKR